MLFRPIAGRLGRFVSVLTGVIAATALVAGSSIIASAAAGPTAYTTSADGTWTNASSYATKDDVYLAAAPCPPTEGSALPAGEYYFEVTDETASQRLSLDSLDERLFEVDASGSIVRVVGHDSAHFQCAAGGLSIKVQPFANLPVGQSRFTLRVTPAGAARACGVDAPFCDPALVYSQTFAIGSEAESPSPSGMPSPTPSTSPSASASAPPTGSAGTSQDPGTSAHPSPTPTTSSAPSGTGNPTPTPTTTPAPRTPPPAANPTPPPPPPAVQQPPGGVYYPAPTPTWTPYAVPSGFFVCKPTEVLTPTGCKTQAQLAAAARSAQPGAGQPGAGQPGAGLVVGGTTPPTSPSDPGALGPMLPGQSGAGVLGVLPTFPPGSGSTPPDAPAPGVAGVGASAELPTQPGLAAPATGGGAPTSAGQNAVATNPTVSSDPAITSSETPASSDRNVSLVVLGLFAAAAIAIASVAGRLLRRRRSTA